MGAEQDSVWTVASYAAHMRIVSLLQGQLDDEREKRFEERDRRYAEVNVEREKALKSKEEADKVALDLARQIQQYKDEKANELREQIGSERNLYATKNDLQQAVEKIGAEVRPFKDYVSGAKGANTQAQSGRQQSNWFVGQVVTVLGLILIVAVGIAEFVLVKV